VSADVCALFNADRLTIYSMGEDKQSIVSKVKTGLNSFKDLKLPIAEHSIAGYVALSKKTANIKDVYDETELRALNPNLRFLQEVDKRTGYRTKQQLVAPIVEQGSNELIGVIQIINNKAGAPFGALAEEGVHELSQTLAIAFKQRQKPMVVKTKYDYLIADAVLSAGEFELASRQARQKAVDIEQVLVDEFQVMSPAIGGALVKFFAVPFAVYLADRIQPAGAIYFMMDESNLALQLKQPWIKISTDAGGIDPAHATGLVHPRAYGTYTRVLGKYVREEKVIPLEDAIRKMSSAVADRLFLRDRGVLRDGHYADVIIFDPETVGDRATFTDPHQLSVGVRDVWVNGTRVLANSEHTNAKPGRFVRGPGTR